LRPNTEGKHGIFSKEECEARQEVMLEAYFSTVEMECLTLIEMIEQNVVPDATKAGVDAKACVAGIAALKAELGAIHGMTTTLEKAHACRPLRMETMVTVRGACDAVEALVPQGLWSLATYKELTFMDMAPNPFSRPNEK
jgi:glutamine synthetase